MSSRSSLRRARRDRPPVRAATPPDARRRRRDRRSPSPRPRSIAPVPLPPRGGRDGRSGTTGGLGFWSPAVRRVVVEGRTLTGNSDPQPNLGELGGRQVKERGGK